MTQPVQRPCSVCGTLVAVQPHPHMMTAHEFECLLAHPDKCPPELAEAFSRLKAWNQIAACAAHCADSDLTPADLFALMLFEIEAHIDEQSGQQTDTKTLGQVWEMLQQVGPMVTSYITAHDSPRRALGLGGQAAIDHAVDFHVHRIGHD